MPKRRFWRGFAAGAAAGAGGALAAVVLANLIGGAARRRIVRAEKSLQIGRPVEEVFRAWESLNWLADASDLVRDVRVEANRSHWTMQWDGKEVEWDAEIEQFIPNQAIGWKSVNGPKHTGRITFAPIGNDTLVQVTMNYYPPRRWLALFTGPIRWPLEHWVDRVLRDFKASLEGKGQERRTAVRGRSENLGPGTELTRSEAERATGTYGYRSETPAGQPEQRSTPVDRNRPSEAKS